MSWLFSQALVAAYSAAICSAGEPSALLNVMPTQRPFWRSDKTMDVLIRSPFGLTWKLLTADTGEAVLTSFLAAFPVRTSAWPARAKASLERGPASGGTLPASLARWDRASASWKTHQRSLDGEWESFSETWPRWGMKRAGECYPQPMPSGLVEHRAWITSVSASGSLESVPTPTANPYGTNRSTSIGSTVRPSLNQMARQGQWRIPTPTVQDANGRDRHNQRDGSTRDSLLGFVRRFRTPSAQDSRNLGGGNAECIKRRREIGKQITFSMDLGIGGQLNPLWVEWLMGWPIGWTDLKPLAMDRFQAWRNSHLKSLVGRELNP